MEAFFIANSKRKRFLETKKGSSHIDAQLMSTGLLPLILYHI